MRTDPALSESLALERRRDDIAIVLGAARGDLAALAALRELIGEASAALVDDVSEAVVVEAAGALYLRLTQARAGGPPAITAFRGERSLAGWVRTQLAREAALRAARVH
jgi:hypothetical protein